MSARPRSEFPEEYNEAYERAYRRSLAEHPTELMSPARPGKRALEIPTSTSWWKSAEKIVAEVILDPKTRLAAAIGGVVLLLLASYGLGRLFA